MAYYSRKATRIPGYDYSCENYYFITICTHDKECIFGNVGHLNDWGEIAYNDLQEISKHFTNVQIDNCVVMPNHIHAIIVLQGEGEINLSHIIGLYKSGVSRKIRITYPKARVWQRSYHDHIIRNQKEHEQIWQYIQYNDQKWETDCFYPKEDK